MITMRCLGSGVIAALALAGVMTWAVPAAGVVFDLVGVGGTGWKAWVSFGYAPLSTTSGRLDVDVANIAPAANPADPPRITGFAFNVPANVTSLTSFSAPFVAANGEWAPMPPIGSPNPPVRCSQTSGLPVAIAQNSVHPNFNLGAFDLAAAACRTDTQIAPEAFLTGGGSPSLGVPTGATYAFDFFLSGSGMQSLTIIDFLYQTSVDPPGGPVETPQSFIVRFITLGGTTSDTASLRLRRPSQVPEAPTIFLLASSLLALAWVFRQRPRTPAPSNHTTA